MPVEEDLLSLGLQKQQISSQVSWLVFIPHSSLGIEDKLNGNSLVANSTVSIIHCH